MAIYAIGDIQGCFVELMSLLEIINFNPSQDTLWFTGDLVNRGPQSLAALRFIKNLAHSICTMGNHDLHLITAAYDLHKMRPDDTFTDILEAPDKVDLIEWLRHRPFFHHDSELQFSMAHAGIYPLWDLQQAQEYARELEEQLRAENLIEFLKVMRGNSPKLWDPNLAGFERLRFICNAFTRMRMCLADGSLDFTYDGTLEEAPANLIPWFDFPQRRTAKQNIIFGHWAALQGVVARTDVFALDTGCVWGHELTALRLDDGQLFKTRVIPRS